MERHGEWERVGGTTDDATAATREEGRSLLEKRAEALVAAIDAFDVATRGSHGGNGPSGEGAS